MNKKFLKIFNGDSNSRLAIVSYCCVDFYWRCFNFIGSLLLLNCYCLRAVQGMANAGTSAMLETPMLGHTRDIPH